MLVHLLDYYQGLQGLTPEWYWHDFRLRLSRGRNHRSDQRLERAALAWAICHNFEPAQWRSERKRHYRHLGQSALQVAGVPPEQVRGSMLIIHGTVALSLNVGGERGKAKPAVVSMVGASPTNLFGSPTQDGTRPRFRYRISASPGPAQRVASWKCPNHDPGQHLLDDTEVTPAIGLKEAVDEVKGWGMRQDLPVNHVRT